MTIDAAEIANSDIYAGEGAVFENEVNDIASTESTTNAVQFDAWNKADNEAPPLTQRKKGARSAETSGPRPARKVSAVRRAVERALVVASLNKAAIGVLAAALDVEVHSKGDKTVADIAVASLEDSGLARLTLATLAELMTVDDLEAGVAATGAATEKVSFKRLWSVLQDLDPELPTSVPSRAVIAGLAVARSVRSLTDDKRRALLTAHEVLG